LETLGNSWKLLETLGNYEKKEKNKKSSLRDCAKHINLILLFFPHRNYREEQV
jgi:hypothetical protein